MKNHYVKHFKDLEVYRRQRSLAREVFKVTKKFPREEQYSLTDQLRRSSRSIGAHNYLLSEEPLQYLVQDD